VSTASPIFRQIIVYGSILALAIGVVGSIVGFLVDGPTGLVSALLGTLMAFVFTAVTAGSILLANRATKSDLLNPVFLIIVLGGWILKFIVFLVLIFILKDQPWVNTVVMFLSIVAAVIGSLVVDVVVVARTRMPYVSDITLPGDEKSSGQQPVA
jgi:hypothetical protein